MSSLQSGQSFENIAANYDRWYESPEGKYIDAQENELFLRLIKPEKGQTIFEIGCGTGHNIAFFQRLGLKVVGIEPSAAMLNIATARCGTDANLPPQSLRWLSGYPAHETVADYLRLGLT